MKEQDRFYGYSDLNVADIPSLSVSDISALDSLPEMQIDADSFKLGPEFNHTNIGTITTNNAWSHGVYTWTGQGTSPYTSVHPATGQDFGKVQINGTGIEMAAEADIKFGDVSLKETLAEIAERLAILVPDAKLEREYEELRLAREHYEYVKSKLQMLEKLKKTPVELPR